MTAIRSSNLGWSILGLLLLWAGSCDAAGLKLPGSPIESPDRKWQIDSQEPAVGDDSHRLVLIDKSNGSTTILDRFPRHAEVLWSPDSERVAITDYYGSDQSDCRAMRRSGADSTSIRKAIRGTRFANLVEGNHHAYVGCRRWITPSTLEFEISAYGDANPKGVTSRGTFDVAAAKIVGTASARPPAK